VGRVKTVRQARLIKLLRNWNTLNASLMKLKERDVAQLLACERANKKRLTFMLRLHARLNKLKSERERIDLVRLTDRNVVLLPEDR
jgi:hypothetical protein